jgi:hypothetical protein
MKYCRVYYKKQSDFRADAVPTEGELKADYAIVWQGYVADDTEAEYIRFSMEEIDGFQRPEEVRHTSMSVGDIVQFDDIYFQCRSTGWMDFTFKK